MQVIFLGYLDPETGEREPRDGFTVGKTYTAQLSDDWDSVYGSVEVLDDDGSERCRPVTDFRPA